MHNKIQEFTKGVVNTVTDLILLELMAFGDLVAGPRTLNETLKQIQKNLQFVEERRIKTMLGNAKTKGWINQKGLLTELGKIKINSKIPHLQPQGKWSGTWFVTVFDIPENQRRARNIFRSYLKEKKFGKLQESVWISPYQHYQSEIEVLEKMYGLEPFVYTLLTKSIGRMPPAQLAERVWNVGALNQKYQEYIEEYSGKKVDRFEGVNSFLAIARGDPQLPSELLPAEWKGEKAFQLYSYIFSGRPS